MTFISSAEIAEKLCTGVVYVCVIIMICCVTTASLSELRGDILQRMFQCEDDVAVVFEACTRLRQL